MIRNLYGYGDYNAKQVYEMAREVEREGLDPTPIYYRRPDAAPEPRETVRSMPLSEIPYLIPDAFAGSAGADLAATFSIDQLKKIGAEGDAYLRGAITIALERAIKESPADEHLKESLRYINQSPAWQE